jgi:hypothetical protein
LLFDALRDVAGPLAGAKLDDAELREAVPVERIFLDQRLDLRLALAGGQDDPAVARDLPATRTVPSA